MIGGFKIAQSVYISYDNKDKGSLKDITDKLKDISYCCSREKITGDKIETQVANAIKGSNIVLLIYTENSKGSSEVKTDLEVAVNHNKTIVIYNQLVETSKGLEGVLNTPKTKIITVKELDKVIEEIKAALVKDEPDKVIPCLEKPKDHSIILILGVVVLSLIIIRIGLWPAPMTNKWLIILFSMFVFFIVVGYSKGKLMGILIDDRNQMSLSRFQMVLWTLIFLSAFITIALSRIATPGIELNDALNIEIPTTLWALIGISTVSLVGTPLILSQKKELEAKDPLETNSMVSVGTVCKNKSINDAKFSDMFTGDEIDDCCRINLAKVQMFFFTIIIVISYSALLFQLMYSNSPDQINDFPLFSESLIALLAISHGGYLTQKAVPSTPENK